MNNTQAASHQVSNNSRRSRPRPVTRAVAVPATQRELLELRDLLAANLESLQALHDEHRKMIATSLEAVDSLRLGLRDELRTIASTRAPWVRALAQTRALLFVALKEIVVGGHEAEITRHMSQDEIDAANRAA